MNAKIPAFIASACLLLAASSQAQYYAPETDYHDTVQRQFVVELARVLAWRENLAGKKIAEVTYTVTTDPDGKTNWRLQWLDAQGKELRHFAVAYTPDLLTSGAPFYRTVFKQMFGEAPKGEITAADLIQSYWEGADSAGNSRTESLRAVFDLVAAKPSEKGLAPKLAGLLTHTALSSMGSGVSLDALVLARGAAWLCIAESNVKKPDAETDALWAPTLFLAARQNAAMTLWKKFGPSSLHATGESALFRWWDLIMHRPKSKDVFLFAADHRKFAMPMLVYTSITTGLCCTMAEVLDPLFADSEKTLSRLYDYSPYIAHDGGVGGGRILEGAWPALARQDWIACLRKFQPGDLDYKGYTDALDQVKAAPPAASEDESSLHGLERQAPLLAEGFHQGAGKLIPVAAVTARDLLNYGWEMTCIQMSARWAFVKNMWGVKELAATIAKTTSRNVPGSDIFFVPDVLLKYKKSGISGVNGPKTQMDDWKRLEGMDETDEWLAVSGIWDESLPVNVETFARRCWLRPGFARDVSSDFYHTDQFDKILPNLRRIHEEGGPVCDARILTWFSRDLLPSGAKRVPGSEAVKTEFAGELPEPTLDQLDILWSAKFDKLPDFQRAQEMEKTFWLRPASDLPYRAAFDTYVKAHAYAAASRFYDQMADLIDERVGFSNGVGPHRFVLALLQKDEPAMKKALEDSATGSYFDMNMHRLECVARDDAQALLRQADEMIERYGESEENKQLKLFIPLIPALKDPANPDHAKALDFFARNKDFPTLQWFWLANSKLNTDEAVRFLGGKETDPQRRLLVFYLLKDKEAFRKTFDDLQKHGQGFGSLLFSLAYYLRNELLDVPVPAEQPDLKPAGAETITQAVTARLEQREKARAEQSLSQLKSADDLWAYFEKLRSNPGQISDRDAAKAYLNQILAATGRFIKAYPDDKRRWDARLVAAQTDAELTQLGGGQIDRAKFEAATKEVAAAKGAPAKVRADARITLIQFHAEGADTPENAKAVPALETEIAAFKKDFPDDARNANLQMLRVSWLQKSDPAQAESLLQGLAKNSNTGVAAQAQTQLRMLGLTKKPFELKFTALDGNPVDMAQMKGKVVLVDFWATWCGPCMEKVPDLVALYAKYHARGLEIVGISLDQDKERVLAVTKEKGMVWPQYFDGKGWQNQISSSYGIDAIPRLFITNKKGFVVETEEPENLDAVIAKLLAE